MSFTPGPGTTYLLTSTQPVPTGTANGVLYLNGSKVVTSGSALTFDGTNLSTTGSVTSTNATTGFVTNASNGFALFSGDPLNYNISRSATTVSVKSGGPLVLNSGLGSPIIFNAFGSEQMRLNSTGLGIGTNNPVGKAQVNGVFIVGGQAATRNTPQLGIGNAQIESSSFASLQIFGNANTTDGSYILLGKTRAGATGGITIVQQNDVLGGLFFTGSDGVNFRSGASIYAEVDGAPAAGSMPGRLVFATTPAGSTSLSIRMRIDSAGNLGLGVTPQAWSTRALEIIGGVGISSVAGLDFTLNAYYNAGWLYRSTGAATRYEQVSGQHRWYNAASGTAGNPISFTQAMTLDASGNLGIGTTSPKSNAGYATLTLNNAVNGGVLQFTQADTTIGQLFFDGNGGTLRSVSNDPLVFGTNNTERARITSGGDFGIGNTNPLYRLTVGKDTTSALAFFTNSNASAPNGAYIDFSAASPNNATQYFLYCEDSTAQRATILSNGGLANYQSNDVDLSDARTKKDITPAPSYWSKIGALEIVTYKYKDQTHDDINVGVIAQQVEQVEPVWVDADGFGETPEGEEPLKTVYTKDITFAAIKALQEAMIRIEQLEARLAAAGI